MRGNSLIQRVILIAVNLILTARLPAQSMAPTANPQFKSNYRTDRILVLPKPTTAMAKLHTQLGTKVQTSFPELRGLQVVTVPATETVPHLIARLQASGQVEFAEPDYELELFRTPNDPRFADGTLWALNNYGQSGGLVDGDIDAPEGWDVLNSASNIVVAVLDTGARYTHEDLAANIWVNPNGGGPGWNAIAGNALPTDDAGHGTMVAGVLGAVGNNGKGVTGVAWRVQMLIGKCFGSFGVGNISDAITCLEFARTNGARVINASWGFNPGSLALSNAVLALRDAGIILVAAAGNSSTDLDANPVYPACYPLDNILSVGYSTRTDTLAAASNYGATNVDLVAPGEQIYSTFGATDNFYYSLSGSSFAAPYVAGTCALLLAKYPAESHQQIIARVLNGVDPLPALAGKCATSGRLNLRKALSPPVSLAFHSMLNFLGQPTARWRISAGPTRNFVVEASTNLITWSAVYGGTTSAAGTADFFDPLAANHPRGFYRVVAEP